MNMDISSVVDRVYSSFEADFRIIVGEIASALAGRCESHIELMLATSFETANRVAGRKIFGIVSAGQEESEATEKKIFGRADDPRTTSDALIHVYPQYNWEGYRIDFYLETKVFRQRVFIECDGHAFHERTADQAERDRKKDRLAQEQGIAILRFTGREIYRSPGDCAAQIMTFLNNRGKTLKGLDK